MVIATSPVHGEGPWWDARDGSLLWIDMLGRTVFRGCRGDTPQTVAILPQTVGAVVGRAAGGLVALQADGVVSIDDAGSVNWLLEIEADQPRNRFNDAKCDPAGRLVAGSLALDKARGAGTLYVVDPDLAVRPLLRSLHLSNGLTWSLDGSRLYHIDSGPSTVTEYPYDVDDGAIVGEPSNRFIVGGGGADGMTIDIDNCLWVAVHGAGEVRRYTPSGDLLTVVKVPARGTTSCMFGGHDLDELYITTSSYGYADDSSDLSGNVFACRTGTAGVTEPMFAG